MTLTDEEHQTIITDRLTELVGHEHHCSICGDEENLFWVKEQAGYQGILCADCIGIQKTMYGTVFVSVVPYHPGSGRQVR